jgi:hypothetical protein
MKKILSVLLTLAMMFSFSSAIYIEEHEHEHRHNVSATVLGPSCECSAHPGCTGSYSGTKCNRCGCPSIYQPLRVEADGPPCEMPGCTGFLNGAGRCSKCGN